MYEDGAPASSGPKTPLVLRDGRVTWRFRAGEIPTTRSPETAVLLEKVRRTGVVLVADGIELHVLERRKGELHPNTLRALRDAAGATIAVLRGEHRERMARLPADCVALYEPRSGARDVRHARATHRVQRHRIAEECSSRSMRSQRVAPPIAGGISGGAVWLSDCATRAHGMAAGACVPLRLCS
jgi:hypothetical protein